MASKGSGYLISGRSFSPQNSSDKLYDFVTYGVHGLSMAAPEPDWASGRGSEAPVLYPAPSAVMAHHGAYMPAYSPGTKVASIDGSPVRNNKKTVNPNLYKTELCRSFDATGYCRYGDRCQFAHGGHELRPILRHPKYKTQLCKTYIALGSCPYGGRCRFIHALTKKEFEEEQKRAEEEKRRERARISLLRTGELEAPTAPEHVVPLPASPIASVSPPIALSTVQQAPTSPVSPAPQPLKVLKPSPPVVAVLPPSTISLPIPFTPKHEEKSTEEDEASSDGTPPAPASSVPKTAPMAIPERPKRPSATPAHVPQTSKSLPSPKVLASRSRSASTTTEGEKTDDGLPRLPFFQNLTTADGTPLYSLRPPEY